MILIILFTGLESNFTSHSTPTIGGERSFRNGACIALCLFADSSGNTIHQGAAYKVMTQSKTLLMEQTQQVLASMMGDAPVCNVCGHITIRSGTCYKCLNCGNSLGGS